jgi:hypothetical protein
MPATSRLDFFWLVAPRSRTYHRRSAIENELLEDEMRDENKTYEAPRIEDHGDLTELTAGRNTGAQTDADFPAHTPVSDLTFTTP